MYTCLTYKCYRIHYRSEKGMIILYAGPPPTQQLLNLLLPSLNPKNANLLVRPKVRLTGLRVCVERHRQHTGRVEPQLKVRVNLNRKCFSQGTWGKKDERYSETCPKRWFAKLLALGFRTHTHTPYTEGNRNRFYGKCSSSFRCQTSESND